MTDSYDYAKSISGYEDLIFVQAHCDERILHAPDWGCIYCNEYPEAQAKREELGVNFTGCTDSDKLPCPADKARPPERMYAWRGNVPTGPDVPEELTELFKEIESSSSKVMYGELRRVRDTRES